MTLVYEAIRAALLFVPLHEIPQALAAFLEHLARSNEKTRPKQIELFQRELLPARESAESPSRTSSPAAVRTPSAPPHVPAPGRPLGMRVASEAWRVSKLVHMGIAAALIFLPLHEIPANLGTFLEHLGRSNEKTRPKQIETFQSQLLPAPG
jgi:hypothetical protein